MPPQADVIILTALKEEYDAILEVETGACPGSAWEITTDPDGREVAFRSFQGTQGGQLRVAVIRAPEKGGAAAVGAVAPLVETYAPRCLAMCGVCAGRQGAVELGDVIIANLLWDYDIGKQERTKAASGQMTERLRGRRLSYPLNPRWRRRAETFSPPRRGDWLAQRPRTYQAQMDWFLASLLNGEPPAEHPQRKDLCANYPDVVRRLREKEWIFNPEPRLTEKGKRYIQERLSEHPDGLPEPKDFKVHVGPIATVTKVQRGPGIFERLVEEDYTVLGLEMEAAALAAFSHEHEIDTIVMKGVMDFADSEKDDHFKHFAARASAECLLAFLRENLPAAPAGSRISEEALAAHKQALMEKPAVRYLELQGLANIEPGSQRMKLDLLEFAVAPSLHDGGEAASAREMELQTLLRRRDAEPAEQQALKKELELLQDERWEHFALRSDQRLEPSSFAKALARHERLVIIGDAGAGKSILLRLALLACADGAVGERARRLLRENDPFNQDALSALDALRKQLPVRVRLGELGVALEKERGLSLEEFIRQYLRKQVAGEELLGSLHLLLEQGRVFLLCDGLDEVAEGARERVVQEVAGLLERYPNIRLLLTSRPHGYRPKVPYLEHARLAPLNPWQQQNLVSRLHLFVETRQQPEATGVGRARQRTQSLLRAIQTRREWQTLSSNPLLLTLSALTRTDGDGLPRHRVIVFNNFVETLLREWRSVIPRKEAERLLAAWASVASTLVRQEKRHGGPKGQFLRMLADALGDPRPSSPTTPEDALRLALERGLVREDEEIISFWHSTFAEFLAAYALTGNDGRGAARRILDADPLPLSVLQLAAARLDHVLDAREEADALARGLMDRDERGEGRLLRPGLRKVSACLIDGVSFDSGLVEQIWASWAKLLARTPPSLAWRNFGVLTRETSPGRLPASLVETFIHLPDRGLYEVQTGISRLVALLARVAPAAAREACARWLKPGVFRHETRSFHAAFGLASLGEWSEEIIGVLGRFRDVTELGLDAIARLIQDGGPALRERLLKLARARFPRDEPPLERPGSFATPPAPTQEEERVTELRFSAACLLAVSGTWDESIAWVLHRTLSGQPSSSRMDEAKTVVRYCAAEKPVQASLLDWIRDDRTLGENAREIVRDVAPLIEDMPRAVLERAMEIEGAVQQKLEELLVSVGAERRSLLDILWGWLELPQEQRQLRAARILRRLARHDQRLHEALRRGMQAPEEAWRAVWAHHSFNLDPALTELALETLQSCARSADPAVRKAVYGKHEAQWRMEELRWKKLDGWLACAADPAVPAAARLDAARLVLPSPGGLERVRAILYTLLESADAKVRHKAAFTLLWHDVVDARVAVVAAEEASRANKIEELLLRAHVLEPFAAEVVRAVLRGLPREPVPERPDEPLGSRTRWDFFLLQLAPRDLSCVEPLIRALEQPGLAGSTAESVLDSLMREHASVRNAIRERLRQVEGGTPAREVLRLVTLGLSHKETQPLAIRASQLIDPHTLSQPKALWLAGRLHSAGAKEEAIRFWRSILDGTKAVRSLHAAAELAFHFSSEAGPWIQHAIALLIESPEPSLRVDAARLALVCGVHEERALEALTGCLELRGQHDDDHWRFVDELALMERRAFDGPSDRKLLDEAIWKKTRIDFVAMRTLYLHRPERGVTWLERWLADEELGRFTFAVESLAVRGHSREAVSAALMARVSPAPDEQLEELLHLAYAQRASPPEVLERLLARHAAGHGSHTTRWALAHWLWRYPVLWAELRRQTPERIESLQFLLYNSPVVTRDTVALAVSSALAQEVGLGIEDLEKIIRSWCQPTEKAQEEFPPSSQQPEAASPEQLRDWLREELLLVTELDSIDACLRFDGLARLAELPPERRIQRLRRALEIDIIPTDHEYTHQRLLYLQAAAALQLLKLGERHDRILPALQLAVRKLGMSWFWDSLPFASALLTLWPDDVTLKQFVLHHVIVKGLRGGADRLLELLEQAQLSSDERITLICVCLGLKPLEAPPAYASSGSASWREVAPSLFEALEKLGCQKERRAALLHDFVSAYGMDLPDHTRQVLLRRPELTPPDAAKLLVGVLASDHHLADENVMQQWLERFASKRSQDAKRSQRAYLWDLNFLSSRMESLAELSQVDEPELVERALAGLTGAPVGEFLPLYERVRQHAQLSEEEWSRLLEHLALGPEEAKVPQVAKEWLTMRLWQALEQPMGT